MCSNYFHLSEFLNAYLLLLMEYLTVIGTFSLKKDLNTSSIPLCIYRYLRSVSKQLELIQNQ